MALKPRRDPSGLSAKRQRENNVLPVSFSFIHHPRGFSAAVARTTRRTIALRSSHAGQLLVHKTHAGVVLESAVRVATGAERHPDAEGRRPSLHSTVTLCVELVPIAQRIAAVLQIADTRHVISGLQRRTDVCMNVERDAISAAPR